MKASARSRTRSSADTRAFIALGTNEGNRLLNLAEAKRRLSAFGALTSGPVLETKALLPKEDQTPQSNYLNTVVALDTPLDVSSLHLVLKRIEKLMGRRVTTRWAPRIIDLDLLLFGSEIIETKELTVPHPRMHERAFVLEPLTVLAPEAVHPGFGRTVRELRRTLRP
ncbi:MAG: 2-amino-4-hydroxy-6-hydroxymethyldihydropteridine diphosphokinase [Archangium sp.]